MVSKHAEVICNNIKWHREKVNTFLAQTSSKQFFHRLIYYICMNKIFYSFIDSFLFSRTLCSSTTSETLCFSWAGKEDRYFKETVLLPNHVYLNKMFLSKHLCCCRSGEAAQWSLSKNAEDGLCSCPSCSNVNLHVYSTVPDEINISNDAHGFH